MTGIIVGLDPIHNTRTMTFFVAYRLYRFV